MNDIRKHFPFVPTNEQHEAIRQLIDFVQTPFSKQHRAFVLKGHAGTGKTSLVQVLLNYFIEYNKQFDAKSTKRIQFVLLASTGRAAKILNDKTKMQVYTVHKQIYTYRPEDAEFNEDDKISFSLVSNQNSANTIFIVDESSMLGNNANLDGYIQFGSGRTLADLLMYVSSHKIIFVGDSAQLPPINEKLSIALSPMAIDECFGFTPTYFHLKQIKRFSEHSSIFSNAKMVLNAILSNQFPERFEPDYGGEDIIAYNDIDSMVKQFAACFNKDRNDVTNCIFVVSTNRLASQLNNSIRNVIFNRPGFLNKGEFLMVTKNNYKYNIMNGDTIKVLSVGSTSQKLHGLALNFREITAGIGVEPYYTTFTTLIIEESLKSTQSSMDIEEEKALLKNFMIRTKDRGIRRNSAEFVQLLMSDPYLNALRVKYGYAVTGHKSQGGEWKDVFIIFQRMLFADEDKRNSYRWIYTAITRASQRLHILNNIGYVEQAGATNYKFGTLIRYSFSGEIEVKQQYFWKSSKGTPMCTFQTETENFLLVEYQILPQGRKTPLFPAIAVFEKGRCIGWK